MLIVIVGVGRIVTFVSGEASEQVEFGSGWQGWAGGLLQWRLERGGWWEAERI